MRQGFGVLMEFFGGGANLALGGQAQPATRQGPKSAGRHKSCAARFRRKQTPWVGFCALFKPWSKLVRRGLGVLMEFFGGGAKLELGQAQPATRQGPKSAGRHKSCAARF